MKCFVLRDSVCQILPVATPKAQQQPTQGHTTKRKGQGIEVCGTCQYICGDSCARRRPLIPTSSFVGASSSFVRACLLVCFSMQAITSHQQVKKSYPVDTKATVCCRVAHTSGVLIGGACRYGQMCDVISHDGRIVRKIARRVRSEKPPGWQGLKIAHAAEATGADVFVRSLVVAWFLVPHPHLWAESFCAVQSHVSHILPSPQLPLTKRPGLVPLQRPTSLRSPYIALDRVPVRK